MRRNAVVLSLSVAALGLLGAEASHASHPVDSFDSSGPVLRAGAAHSARGSDNAAPGNRQASAARVIKRGMSGPYVKRLQRRLRIPADGQFGPQTEAAVRRFQRRRRLQVDGVVGPITARALGIPLPRARRVSGSRGQRRLLNKIAKCESGGNPRAVSANGRYRGKYQFDHATWRSMGGRGDPARASEREQDRRAMRLLRKRGTAPWPSCG